MSKKAIVTGATGFVGSNLVAKLIEEGWQVGVIVREESKYEQFESMEHVSIFFYNGTVEILIEIIATFKPDIVFHLASLFLSSHRPSEINALIQSNILFGTHLLEAMAQNGVSRFVNTGTSWQHFENHEYDPVCLYAATKQAYEDIVTYYARVYEIKAITLKLFDTYGTGDSRLKLLALLNNLRYEQNNMLGMSPGDQIINLVHIKDVINAYILSSERLLSNLVLETESYAVSANEEVSIKELVMLIEQILHAKLPIQWGIRPYRSREVMIPWNKGTRLPGWEPKISLIEGLHDYFSES